MNSIECPFTGVEPFAAPCSFNGFPALAEVHYKLEGSVGVERHGTAVICVFIGSDLDSVNSLRSRMSPQRGHKSERNCKAENCAKQSFLPFILRHKIILPVIDTVIIVPHT